MCNKRCFHAPVRSLKSSNTNLVTVPFVSTAVGAHILSVTSPKIWNSLPAALHSCNCPDTFCLHLKTHYFQQAFLSSLHHTFGICWHCMLLYISFTYLL